MSARASPASVWACGWGKFVLPPSHYCQRKRRLSDKWLHWIGGVNEACETLRGSKEWRIRWFFNFCVISVMRSYKNEDILSKKKKNPNIYMTNQQMFYSCPLNVGPPVCRLTKWIFQYALCSWAYFSSTSIRRHQAWFSSVNNTRHSKAHSNDSSKCRGLTASIAQQRKNKSQQNHRVLELCRRDTFFLHSETCLWSKICSL